MKYFPPNNTFKGNKKQVVVALKMQFSAKEWQIYMKISNRQRKAFTCCTYLFQKKWSLKVIRIAWIKNSGQLCRRILYVFKIKFLKQIGIAYQNKKIGHTSSFILYKFFGNSGLSSVFPFLTKYVIWKRKIHT